MNLEFQNVLSWAKNNKLIINVVKIKELIFHKPNPRNVVSPVELPGRVQYAKLYGVWFARRFSNEIAC